jgi:hypothetical protein
MGTKNFFKSAHFQPSGLNLEARAGAAGGYASKGFSSGAQKDIGVAQALYRNSKLKPTSKTAVSAAPGPKKV